MAHAANAVAIRGAVLLVLLVGALVSSAEATRNSRLGVAAAPGASVHPTSIVGCFIGCETQFGHCSMSCMNKPLLEAPECGLACTEANFNCFFECRHAPALGPMPHA